jgi:dihydroorotase
LLNLHVKGFGLLAGQVMQNYLIKNISIVNEGRIEHSDVLIKNGRVEKILPQIAPMNSDVVEVNGEGKFLLPGVIDDQVHFREPGLTHKATIYTESKAAVAGGVTSFMEMPNTVPPAFTEELLEHKYAIAAGTSLANYSFYMGTSNDNADEVLKINAKKNQVCGVKIFMGASTGNLLVDDPRALDKIFSESELLIATHCEDEETIKQNLQILKSQKKHLTAADHPVIRDEEACYRSSHRAVEIAKKYNSRLHILHISTEKELELFSNLVALKEKRITAEVCVHHLHFTSNDYERLGNQIKCNPAIKSPNNKEALWKALLDNRLDVIATDHAPHTWEEKIPLQLPQRGSVANAQTQDSKSPYELAASGLPLVQHPLLLMLSYFRQGKISLETLVEKMSHAVADCFQIQDRGYIREGYWADLVIVDMDTSTRVTKENILYKCGWSPLENMEFPAAVTHTFVSGNLVYDNGRFYESQMGKRLNFGR